MIDTESSLRHDLHPNKESLAHGRRREAAAICRMPQKSAIALSWALRRIAA